MTSLPRCAVWTIPYPFEACPCLRCFEFAFAVFPECRSCPIPAALLSHRRSLSCDRSWHTDEERISHSDGHSVVDFRILMSLTSYFRAKKQALHISTGSTTSHSFRKACAIRFDMQGLNCVKLFAVGSALDSRKHFLLGRLYITRMDVCQVFFGYLSEIETHLQLNNLCCLVIYL